MTSYGNIRMRCPFCNKENIDKPIICNCGYKFDVGEITDKMKIIGWLNTPDQDGGWYTKILKMKKIHDFQNKNSQRWSKTKTGYLLNKDKGTISIDLRLAESFNDYPELQKCKNKSKAKKRLYELGKDISFNDKNKSFEYEKVLHKQLVKNWNKYLFTNNWNLVKSGYKTNEVGDIDILAKHKEEKKWLVIELKKDQMSDTTIGQLLRYMGFIKMNNASEDESVQGLIIARSIDLSILYASALCPEIELIKYKYLDNELHFEEVNKKIELGKIYFAGLSKDEQDSFIRELENLKKVKG